MKPSVKRSPTKTTGMSRMDRIIKILNKDPKRRFTVQDVLDKIGFNTDAKTVKAALEKLLSEGQIKSENISKPTGVITVYYVDIQSNEGQSI